MAGNYDADTSFLKALQEGMAEATNKSPNAVFGGSDDAETPTEAAADLGGTDMAMLAALTPEGDDVLDGLASDDVAGDVAGDLAMPLANDGSSDLVGGLFGSVDQSAETSSDPFAPDSTFEFELPTTEAPDMSSDITPSDDLTSKMPPTLPSKMRTATPANEDLLDDLLGADVADSVETPVLGSTLIDDASDLAGETEVADADTAMLAAALDGGAKNDKALAKEAKAKAKEEAAASKANAKEQAQKAKAEAAASKAKAKEDAAAAKAKAKQEAAIAKEEAAAAKAKAKEEAAAAKANEKNKAKGKNKNDGDDVVTKGDASSPLATDPGDLPDEDAAGVTHSKDEVKALAASKLAEAKKVAEAKKNGTATASIEEGKRNRLAMVLGGALVVAAAAIAVVVFLNIDRNNDDGPAAPAPVAPGEVDPTLAALVPAGWNCATADAGLSCTAEGNSSTLLVTGHADNAASMAALNAQLEGIELDPSDRCSDAGPADRHWQVNKGIRSGRVVCSAVGDTSRIAWNETGGSATFALTGPTMPDVYSTWATDFVPGELVEMKPFPNRREQDLINSLPATSAPTCARFLDEENQLTAGAVQCFDPAAGSWIFLDLVTQNVDDYYNGYDLPAPGSGDCAAGEAGQTTYSVGADETGRVACLLRDNNVAVQWTNNLTNVSGQYVVPGTDISAAMATWTEEIVPGAAVVTSDGTEESSTLGIAQATGAENCEVLADETVQCATAEGFTVNFAQLGDTAQVTYFQALAERGIALNEGSCVFDPVTTAEQGIQIDGGRAARMGCVVADNGAQLIVLDAERATVITLTNNEPNVAPLAAWLVTNV